MDAGLAQIIDFLTETAPFTQSGRSCSSAVGVVDRASLRTILTLLSLGSPLCSMRRATRVEEMPCMLKKDVCFIVIIVVAS
jgi:hypothetical protein